MIQEALWKVGAKKNQKHHFGLSCNSDMLQRLLLQHPHQVAVQLLLSVYRKKLWCRASLTSGDFMEHISYWVWTPCLHLSRILNALQRTAYHRGWWSTPRGSGWLVRTPWTKTCKNGGAPGPCTCRARALPRAFSFFSFEFYQVVTGPWSQSV